MEDSNYLTDSATVRMARKSCQASSQLNYAHSSSPLSALINDESRIGYFTRMSLQWRQLPRRLIRVSGDIQLSFVFPVRYRTAGLCPGIEATPDVSYRAEAHLL